MIKYVVVDTIDNFGIERVDVSPFIFQSDDAAEQYKDDVIFEDERGILHFENELHDTPKEAVEYQIKLRKNAIIHEQNTIKKLEALLISLGGTP